jgi:hypothetical protein
MRGNEAARWMYIHGGVVCGSVVAGGGGGTSDPRTRGTGECLPGWFRLKAGCGSTARRT